MLAIPSMISLRGNGLFLCGKTFFMVIPKEDCLFSYLL